MANAGAGRELPNPPIFIIGYGALGHHLALRHRLIAPTGRRRVRVLDVQPLERLRAATKAHWGDGLLATRESAIGRRPGLGQLVTREEVFETVRSLSCDWLGRALGEGQRFVVEKGPIEYEIIDELFPDARYVHIIRDGRDVAVSVYEASRSWAPDMLAHACRSLAGSARLWQGEVARILELREEVGDRFYELRYEDLRADPLPQARRVFDFCGSNARTPNSTRSSPRRRSRQRSQPTAPASCAGERSTAWRSRFGLDPTPCASIAAPGRCWS